MKDIPTIQAHNVVSITRDEDNFILVARSNMISSLGYTFAASHVLTAD